MGIALDKAYRPVVKRERDRRGQSAMRARAGRAGVQGGGGVNAFRMERKLRGSLRYKSYQPAEEKMVLLLGSRL